MSSKDFDEKDLMKDIDTLNLNDSGTEEISSAEIKEDEGSYTDDAKKEKRAKRTRGSKRVFSTKQVVLLVVAVVIAVLAIGTIVVCTVADVNPISYVVGEASKDKLVNKWQSQTAPGLTAYEFFEDGTYTSYLSTYSFDGEYEVKGDDLILKNPSSNQSVIYKYKIVGDTLTLTMTDSNGTVLEDREPNKFDRVDSLNQKSIQDMIDEYRSSVSEDSTSAEETTAQAN